MAWLPAAAAKVRILWTQGCAIDDDEEEASSDPELEALSDKMKTLEGRRPITSQREPVIVLV